MLKEWGGKGNDMGGLNKKTNIIQISEKLKE